MNHTPSQRFIASYTPCTDYSHYHDLQCNHRIRSPHVTEPCGANCLRPHRGAGFICPDCLVADVRVEMVFEGLDLLVTNTAMHNDNGPTREQQIQDIADAELRKLLRQGYRMCKLVDRFEDPKMQFFHEFLLDEGFEGVDSWLGEDDGRGRDMEKGGKHKYPNASTRYKVLKTETSQGVDAWKMRDAAACVSGDVGRKEEAETTFTLAEFMQDWENVDKQINGGQGQLGGDSGLDGVLDQLKETRLGLEVEDDATRAVREAFGHCTLT